MNPNLPLVLCFGLQPKQASALRVLCIRFGIQYVTVKEEQYGEKLGVLCGLDTPADVPFSKDHALSEPMLVFCNLQTADISRFLSAARAAKTPRPSLLAMFTDTNRQWTPAELQSQLAAERRAVNAKMESIHAKSAHEHHHPKEEDDENG